jgi:hypothetical protein
VTINSVTDNQGNTYTLLGTLYGGDANQKMGVYLATGVTGNASLVVSANLSGSAPYRVAAAAQYSGLASYDASSTGKLDQSSTAHTTNPVTTTAAGDLVVGWFVSWDGGAATASQSGSWTIVTNSGGDSALVDQVVTTAAAYSPAVTTSVSYRMVSIAHAFKKAP